MIDNISVQQRIQQFDLKHGVDDAVKSRDGVYWLFPDGARRETNIYGLLEDAPNPKSSIQLHAWGATPESLQLKLLERLKEYHETRFLGLAEEFTHLKGQMIAGHYDDDQMQRLNALKQKVHAAQHQMNLVEADRLKLCPIAANQRFHAEAQAERKRLSDAVKSINI